MKKKNTDLTRILILTAAISLVALVLLLVFGFFKARSSIADTYNKEKEDAINKTYDKIWQMSYDYAERKNHVANDVSIRVVDVEKVSSLEVLTLYDQTYVAWNAKESSYNYTSWMEYNGRGKYTVDLQHAVFTVDAQRKTVRVVVPKPELTDFDIVERKKLFQREPFSLFNGRYSDGEALAKEQENIAYTEMLEKMMSNQDYYQDAVEQTKKVLENLIESINNSVDGLVVEVEVAE